MKLKDLTEAVKKSPHVNWSGKARSSSQYVYIVVSKEDFDHQPGAFEDWLHKTTGVRGPIDAFDANYGDSSMYGMRVPKVQADELAHRLAPHFLAHGGIGTGALIDIKSPEEWKQDVKDREGDRDENDDEDDFEGDYE